MVLKMQSVIQVFILYVCIFMNFSLVSNGHYPEMYYLKKIYKTYSYMFILVIDNTECIPVQVY